MTVISESVDRNVEEALCLGYSEYQIARMYNLRVAAIRAIRVQMQQSVSPTRRNQETPLQMSLRLHEDLFRHDLEQESRKYRGESWGEVRGRWQAQNPQVQNLPKLDYAGLEARVLAGFFTPNGVPTPAFWGFISQYVKKSGHAMLDILHDQEIYAPEQLQRALDIDSQLEDMTQEQRIALLRRVTNAVYANAIQDPTSPGADVSDGQ